MRNNVWRNLLNLILLSNSVTLYENLEKNYEVLKKEFKNWGFTEARTGNKQTNICLLRKPRIKYSRSKVNRSSKIEQNKSIWHLLLLFAFFYMVGVKVWDLFFFFFIWILHSTKKILYLSKTDFGDKILRYLNENLTTKIILS